MNMQALMQQAQKMQRDINKKKDELYSKEFTGNSEMVEVVFKGDKSLKSVNLKVSDLSLDDKEILEDMITIAVNDALKKIDKESESMLGAYGSQLNGLI